MLNTVNTRRVNFFQVNGWESFYSFGEADPFPKGADVLASSGTVDVVGAGALSQLANSIASSGTVVVGAGIVIYVQGAQILVSSGTVDIVGEARWTKAPDIISASTIYSIAKHLNTGDTVTHPDDGATVTHSGSGATVTHSGTGATVSHSATGGLVKHGPIS